MTAKKKPKTTATTHPVRKTSSKAKPTTAPKRGRPRKSPETSAAESVTQPRDEVLGSDWKTRELAVEPVPHGGLDSSSHSVEELARAATAKVPPKSDEATTDPIDAFAQAEFDRDQPPQRLSHLDGFKAWWDRWKKKSKPPTVKPPPYSEEEWTAKGDEELGLTKPSKPPQEEPQESPSPDAPGGSDLDGNQPVARYKSRPLPLERDRLEALERFRSNLRNRKLH